MSVEGLPVLVHEKVWTNRAKYEDAEMKYYEMLAKQRSGSSMGSLASEIAKARESLQQSLTLADTRAAQFSKEAEDRIGKLENTVQLLMKRVGELEAQLAKVSISGIATSTVSTQSTSEGGKKEEEEDDIDLFGSDDEEDAEAERIKEERLAAYAAKKSKKPALIAKSNVILDVKPWDDETDMAEMEKQVRSIQCDGLLWGAAKLVPLAYGIKKLQISSVVEDDKVSVDWLQEQIEAFEELVQSVDIAAFNKI
ncbi:unnamed protein product [Darwinula stevensoni]|uniref:Elongation factor 1-delta n=1 Tax=Darwinula stevensoni TaxID=69355 RepID=A0A7R8XCT7_9CRUS|nr:unnamed protein product [Darwinula stevensoni]CAG0894036.1 unnamed protein product [Darwinula stevensoni]